MKINILNVNFCGNDSTNNNIDIYNFRHVGKVIPSPGTQNPRDSQDWDPRTFGHSKFTVTTIPYEKLAFTSNSLQMTVLTRYGGKAEPHQIPSGIVVTLGPVMMAATSRRPKIIKEI